MIQRQRVSQRWRRAAALMGIALSGSVVSFPVSGSSSDSRSASGRSEAQLERVDPDTVVPSTSVEELALAVEETETAPPNVIDVRLASDFDSDPVLIPGASWKDPNAIETWAKDLNPDEPVVVYCVRGHWVSQSVTKKLEDMGFEVAQLEGGIEAWKAAGKPTEPPKP